MARNRPVRVPRPRVVGRHAPRPPTYRYRTGGWNGEARYSRLQTVDLDLLGLKPGERILDVGCGSGRHVLAASRRDCHAVGVELGAEEFRTGNVYLFLPAGAGGLRG